MKYRIVDLGTDYAGKIDDFSKARNTFLETLPDEEYVLWHAHDETLTIPLLKWLSRDPGGLPYYAIRRINLVGGKWASWANPELSPHLVSNRVRYEGRIHEHVVPRKPYGIVDYPIIHDMPNGDYRSYSSGWKETPAYRPVLAFKKTVEVLRGR